MRFRFRRFGAMLSSGVLVLSAGSTPVPGQGQLHQSLEAFYSPSAAAFSADGNTLFITNAARGDYGMIAERGAISKVRLQQDGQFKLEAARFVDKLSAPVGIAVLPGPVAGLPEGTLVVSVGGTWTVDSAGRPVEPRAAGTGLAFFDAATGSELGRVYLGQDSPVHTLLGHPVLDPGAVTADLRGNLYLADLAGGGTAVPRADAAPGVVKINPEALGMLLRGQAPSRGSVDFAAIRDIPTGLVYSVEEDALYWGTGSATGELGGAILRLPRGDFSGVARLETVSKLTNSLASVTVTPGGTVVAARNEGDLIYARGRGRFRTIRFRHDFSFLSPGQIAAARLPNGSSCLVIPETAGGGMGTWRHRVQFVTLPADF